MESIKRISFHGDQGDVCSNTGSSVAQSNLTSTTCENSLENRLSSLLSVSNLEKFLKISGENKKLNEDDDDLHSELSRLNQIERNLSRDLDRYRFLNQTIAKSIYGKKETNNDMVISNIGNEHVKDDTAYMSLSHDSSSPFNDIGLTSSRQNRMLLLSRQIKELNECSINSRNVIVSDLPATGIDEERFVGALAYMRLREEDVLEKSSTTYKRIIDDDLVRSIANALFGSYELSPSSPLFWRRANNRIREYCVSISISTSLVTAASFCQCTTLQVWYILCLPLLVATLARKVPQNEHEVSLVLSILCLRFISSLFRSNQPQPIP